MADVTRHASSQGDDPGLSRGVEGKPASEAGTGLTGGAELTQPGADAGVTSGTRAATTGANLGETEAAEGRTD